MELVGFESGTPNVKLDVLTTTLHYLLLQFP